MFGEEFGVLHSSTAGREPPGEDVVILTMETAIPAKKNGHSLNPPQNRPVHPVGMYMYIYTYTCIYGMCELSSN